ncbi:DASH complex subunit dam1 [Kalmusia sp. IMI 367209]|nr:DASH complex subunit dam1 [Kalmusia sp. IMI 367209]
MASTTPLTDPPSTRRLARSKSPATRSRPTTPLRPSSRSSFRDSVSRGRAPYASATIPLEDLQDHFAELSDAMADLESNFAQLQLMHESLSRFSESFASFLYGLNMNAFCVDFSEAPVSESFKRPLNNPEAEGGAFGQSVREDVDATFLTTDTSFVENPPSSKLSSKYQDPVTPAPKKMGAVRGEAGFRGLGRGGESRRVVVRRGGREGQVELREGEGEGREVVFEGEEFISSLRVSFRCQKAIVQLINITIHQYTMQMQQSRLISSEGGGYHRKVVKPWNSNE